MARKSPSPLPDLDCACASVRRASRLITQLYADEMGPGIEPGQFALLMALDAMPGCGQTPLGRALGFDKTTLSRNLRLMKRNGWIESASPVESGRAGYRLTAGGRGLFKATKPGWKRAQAKLRSAMKGEAWEAMMDGFGLAARAAFRASRD